MFQLKSEEERQKRINLLKEYITNIIIGFIIDRIDLHNTARDIYFEVTVI